MTILHLGVHDIPYTDQAGVTTGDVAQILEDHYDVMDAFVFLHKEEIAEEMAISAADAIESLINGSPVLIDPFAAAMSSIGEKFRDYLDKEEIVNVQGDFAMGKVPTQAALDGVSSRFKLGKQAAKYVKGKRGRTKLKGVRRPSFIDTGLYQATFTAWMDK